jgi:hypothetical protein
VKPEAAGGPREANHQAETTKAAWLLPGGLLQTSRYVRSRLPPGIVLE